MRSSAPTASPATRESFRKQLRANELNDKEIEIQVADTARQFPMLRHSRHAGGRAAPSTSARCWARRSAGAPKPRRVTVKDSHELLIARGERQADRPATRSRSEAIRAVENNGIVFLDEIDKICSRGETARVGAEVSREGVQRDLLPLIEGTTVSTKYGPVKTDHVLFIASGAFHVAKPSDLLPELQGRLPIRVELKALTREDFRRILTEPEASLIKQYVALMATEGVTLEFTDDAIDALADIAVLVNSTVENIGARRLQTVMERVLDEISFEASDRDGETITIDAAYVSDRIGELAKNADLSQVHPVNRPARGRGLGALGAAAVRRRCRSLGRRAGARAWRWRSPWRRAGPASRRCADRAEATRSCRGALALLGAARPAGRPLFLARRPLEISSGWSGSSRSSSSRNVSRRA